MSQPDKKLLGFVAIAVDLAGALHDAQLPACDCDSRLTAAGDEISTAGGVVPATGVETWCHTHRARYFASQLARELRILTQPPALSVRK